MVQATPASIAIDGRRGGFTLLELMIAVFILAMSAAVLLGTASTGNRMMGYSNNMAVINMLARAKMQDLEYEVLSEGFEDLDDAAGGGGGGFDSGLDGGFDEGLDAAGGGGAFAGALGGELSAGDIDTGGVGYSDRQSGDFSDEGYPDIEWEATIESVEIGDEAANDFVQVINEQLYGTGEEAGSLSGNAAFSQFLPLMIGYMPTIINQLGQRIRKVELTVSWDYLGREQSLTVSQYVVRVAPPEEGAAGGGVQNPDADGDGIDDVTGEEQ